MQFPRLISAAVVLFWLAVPLAGQTLVPLPARTGPILLTVTGLDATLHPGGKLELDRGMLQAIGTATITTTSIWTEGRHTYTGVALKALAAELGAGDANLRFHALNDYAVEFAAGDSNDTAPILAYEVDGVPMSVRDKGPVWVLYPFDASAEYRTDMIYERSIWQLDRIDVLR